MSMFKCAICENDYDSDYHEMYSIEEFDVCEDCHKEEIQRREKC